MKLPISTSDFLVTASDCAELLTKIKLSMRQLESAMQHHIDDYLKEVIDTDIKIDTDNKRQNVNFDKHMELWMNDLKKQLINLEFFGRAATLRIFVYYSNYLHILRKPIKRSYDQSYKLPVYNIEFPKNEHIKPTLLLKELSKSKKKKLLPKISKGRLKLYA